MKTDTTLPPDDIASKVAEQVWNALDRNSCPDIYMKIAYEAARAATILAIHRDRGTMA